jgi:UDP-glucose 4-epimerase
MKADVRDQHALGRAATGVDAIVHLAAVKKIGEDQSAIPTLTVNSQGTHAVLLAAAEAGAKVVYASTSDVYGMSGELPFSEDGPLLLGPSHLRRWSYAASKLYDEHLCLAFHHDRGVRLTILRYFGAYSARSAFLWSGGHIPLFIDAILHDREVLVHGDGSQTRCMAYVDDVVAGTVQAVERDSANGEIVNIGSEEELSVLDTAHLLHELAQTGRPLRIKHVPLGDVFGRGYREIMRRVPDLTKAKRLLDYEPKVALTDGLRLTLEGVRQAGANREPRTG